MWFCYINYGIKWMELLVYVQTIGSSGHAFECVHGQAAPEVKVRSDEWGPSQRAPEAAHGKGRAHSCSRVQALPHVQPQTLS